MQETAYLALGSNLGDPRFNLQAAIHALWEIVIVRRVSRVFETEPWGFLDQPNFLNQVVEIETSLDPLSLLGEVKRIETEMGRQPTFRNGPRLIDIDILFYADWVLEEAGLVIPHPRLHERAFVLVPLAELAADFVHPLLRRSVTQMLQDVDQSGVKPL